MGWHHSAAGPASAAAAAGSAAGGSGYWLQLDVDPDLDPVGRHAALLTEVPAEGLLGLGTAARD